jgi:hypothetical protein
MEGPKGPKVHKMGIGTPCSRSSPKHEVFKGPSKGIDGSPKSGFWESEK